MLPFHCAMTCQWISISHISVAITWLHTNFVKSTVVFVKLPYKLVKQTVTYTKGKNSLESLPL